MPKNDKSHNDRDRKPNPGWFAKGRSGNPRGRPKKKKEASLTNTSFRDGFLKMAEASIRLTENGKEIELPVHEAVARAEALSGLRGSPYAQSNFTERHERLTNDRMKDIAADHEKWRDYMDRYPTLVEHFRKQGGGTPDYYPHPNELLFQEGRFVTGWLKHEPIQGSILRTLYIRERDIWLLQAEKDRRHYRSKEELNHVSGMIGLFVNALLPEVFQLDVVTLSIRLGQQRVLRKRDLQERLTREWAEIGVPHGKDLVTWPVDDPSDVLLQARKLIPEIVPPL